MNELRKLQYDYLNASGETRRYASEFVNRMKVYLTAQKECAKAQKEYFAAINNQIECV